MTVLPLRFQTLPKLDKGFARELKQRKLGQYFKSIKAEYRLELPGRPPLVQAKRQIQDPFKLFMHQAITQSIVVIKNGSTATPTSSCTVSK